MRSFWAACFTWEPFDPDGRASHSSHAFFVQRRVNRVKGVLGVAGRQNPISPGLGRHDWLPLPGT
jgi:hypothetical protein